MSEGTVIEHEHEPNFIERHKFICIGLPVICLLLFALQWGINQCGSSTNSFCKTLSSIGNALSAITSPLVSAWRNLILFFAVMVGLAGLIGGMKLLGFLGGKKGQDFTEAKAAEDEGAEVAVKENEDGTVTAALVDKDGNVLDITPTDEKLNEYSQQVETQKAENQSAGPSIEGATMTNTHEGAKIGLEDGEEFKDAEGEAHTVAAPEAGHPSVE